MTHFKLRFSEKDIVFWTEKYSFEDMDRDKIEIEIRETIIPEVRQRGYFTKTELLTIGRWKSARPTKHYESNDEVFVQEVTQIALTTKSERLRIEVLTLLNGVSWPVASTLLHFAFENQYPILDFRALWSLGIDTIPTYNFAFWKSYYEYCRHLAKTNNVSIRTLDKALWQYSKENQL